MKCKNLLKLIRLVCIVVFLFAAVNIIIICHNYRKADKTYQDLQQNFVETIPTTPTSSTETLPSTPTQPSYPTNSTDPTTPTNPTTPSESTTPTEPTPPANPTEPALPTEPSNPTDPTDPPAPTEPTNPTEPTEPTEPTQPKYTVPISVNFQELTALNQDIVGWLYSPNTVINYPVAQGKDNNQYLHSDIYGNYLQSGTLFVDFRNKKIGEDANFLIYGHNMKNGSMFGSLLSYHSYYYYADHPVMYYLTPEQNYAIELYVGVVVKSNANIYLPSATDYEIRAILAELKKKSTFVSNITIDEDDTFVTLSTCSYEFDDARYVVIGKVIPIN